MRSGFNKVRLLLAGDQIKSIKSGELDTVTLPVKTEAFFNTTKLRQKLNARTGVGKRKVNVLTFFQVSSFFTIPNFCNTVNPHIFKC